MRRDIHKTAGEAHWRAGPANDLNGDEDGLIADAAKRFWEECDMATKRKQAVANVTAGCRHEDESQRLKWDEATVRFHIKPFQRRGQLNVLPEGQGAVALDALIIACDAPGSG